MQEKIIKSYFPKNTIKELALFGNGHINNTYKVTVENMPIDYVLQQINTNVFPNPQGIVENHIRLKKVFNENKSEIEIADIIPDTSGSYLVKGEWRLTSFIKNSHSIEVVKEDWEAKETGRAFGLFAKTCSTLNPNDFSEAIKDFHKLSFRLKQLNEAIENDEAKRFESVKDIVDFYKNRESQLNNIEALINSGKIPIRVVHNDTKINNLLFKGNKAAAVIDLDTVGPGILYYDYGDALRTSANTAVEDEKDLSLVSFNLSAFEAFTKGYVSQVKPIVSESEKEYFYMAPVLMTYIMGIRFLADYLNGDKYYKTEYSEHNLIRAKVQKKLIESMEENQEAMKKIIADTLK